MKNSFENIRKFSKRKPNKIETDGGRVFSNSSFENLLNNNNVEHYSRNSSLGTALLEKFKRTIGDLLKRPVFERSDGNQTDVIPTITKQNNNRVHSTVK